MERRRSQRSKKRMGCTLWVEGTRYSGIVIDISATGLFVQSSANAAPGAEVRIELNALAGDEPIVLHASVARRKVVPARLKSVAQGGVGVRIGQAPEEYYALLAGIQRLESAAVEEEKPKPAKRKSTGLEKKALAAALRRSLGVEIGALTDSKRKGAEPEASPPKPSKVTGKRPKPARPGSGLRRKALAAALRSSLGVEIEDENPRRK